MKIGIDIGSREVKIYYVNKEGNSTARKYSTIEFYQTFGSNKGGKFVIAPDRLIEDNGVSLHDITIAVTGYGKNSLSIHGVNIVSEIQAHAAGAAIQTGFSDFTLLDIGGQDTKVICVKGRAVENFVMNDKCAAGTGRYLENIARILNLHIEGMGRYRMDPIDLNCTCAIFGETEIVTRIAEGYSADRLCSGANLSVARRIIPLIHRFNADKLVIVGGVAKNDSVIHFISKETTAEVVIPPLPQFNGAIGCSGNLCM